ncbi:MAG: glutamate-1-semialdehyde 2,1-aminomutase [Vicinamibacterales bacterium]
MSTTAPATAVSWFDRAAAVTPGGVHSPVRAFAAVGTPPIAIADAHGAHLRDTAGRTFVDYIGAWGPALLGHGHPAIEAAVVDAATRGLLFGLAGADEVTLAERIVARVPGCQMVRFTVTGTEATMSAVRVARAATGRQTILKFAGGYHGHADMFLVAAGSGAATFGIPDSPGVSSATAADTAIAQFNDLDSVDRALAAARGRVAAIVVEPVVGNMGCVVPEPGFLEGLRERCSRLDIVLIFDEVMTGFRVARGGAAERYGVTPDLVTLGKVIGGGMPLAAFGGQWSLMQRVAPAGPVPRGDVCGTSAVHRGGARRARRHRRKARSLREPRRGGARLQAGLEAGARAAGVDVSHSGSGRCGRCIASRPVRGWADASAVDRDAYALLPRHAVLRSCSHPRPSSRPSSPPRTTMA